MLHAIKRKIITDLFDIATPITMRDGKAMSVKQWLLSAKDDNKPEMTLVVGVETIPDSSSAILYHENNESSLSCLLMGLRVQLLKYFPESELSKVFTNAPQKSTSFLSRVVSDSEKSWADIIKRKYLSNPQCAISDADMVPPNKNRRVVYFSSTDKPEKLKNNTFDNDDEKTQSTVTTMDSSVETKLHNLEALIASSVATAVTNLEGKIYTKMDAMRDETDKKFQSIEQKSDNQFQRLNNGFDQMSNKFDELLARLTQPESTATPMDMDDGGKEQ